jgi:uncharacterized protein (TIGR01777 family)
MRIIITGGTGLIGRHLAGSLAADGHEVIVLSRNPERAQGLPAGVRLEKWDGRTAAGWGHLADGAGAIVNLAGENLAGNNPPFDMRWTPERKRRILESRLNAGRAVVEAIQAAATKPLVLVQSSAVGYYGPRGDEDITEQASAGSGFQADVCVQWERSTDSVEALGVRRVLIRTAPVLSPEGVLMRMMLLPVKLFVGGPIGGGQQWFPWIHLADEVAAIRFLIDQQEASGPFNLCAPGIVRNRDFYRTAGKVLGRPSFFPTPGFLLKLALGEVSELVLAGQRQIPARLQQMGFSFRFPELEGALRDLLRK